MPTAPTARDDRAAIDKAISVLGCFGDDAIHGVGVTELARRAHLSKSTTHRVLGMLERNGVVERVGTDYRLGGVLHNISRSAAEPTHEALRDALIPFLTDLFVATGETVHLAALCGTDVVYLAKLYGHRRIGSPSRIGQRLPAHCTAVGKALLAYNSEAARLAATAPLSRLTPDTITDPGKLVLELDAVRAAGISTEDGEVQAGLSCVAVPVMGTYGAPAAALSVSAPTGRLDVARTGNILRRVASAASLIVRRSGIVLPSSASLAS